MTDIKLIWSDKMWKRLSRKERKKQKKILIIGSLSLLLFLCVGYAAFSTNFNITSKANIKTYTADDLKNIIVNEGDGLYKDEYEDGRYAYKGAAPDNYIWFNNEMWRIISIESDNTYKIIKNETLSNRQWDTNNINNWKTPSTLNTYLSSNYYNTLSAKAKNQMVSHDWSVGKVEYNNDDLINQIYREQLETWTGSVGLIVSSEYIRANTNIEQCNSLNKVNLNVAECVKTNWLSGIDYWSITTYTNEIYAYSVRIDGRFTIHFSNDPNFAVRPVVYLNSNIILIGSGTYKSPCQILK